MRRKTRLYPEEQFELLRRNFGLTARPDNGQEALEKTFRARHSTRATTRKQANFRAAGRFVAFERLGMGATFAVTHGLAGGRQAWDGNAHAIHRATAKQGREASPLATFTGEAIAALCAPVAEELRGGGDLLNSVSLLVAGACYATRAAELEGRDEEAVVREVAARASILVERHEDDIRAVADMLAEEKRVDRRDFAVRDIFARLPPGPLTGPLSAKGQAVCNKIVGAVAELRSLGLPTFGTVAWFGEVM